MTLPTTWDSIDNAARSEQGQNGTSELHIGFALNEGVE